MILLTFTRHSSLRLAELGFLLMGIGGAVLLVGELLPLGRRLGGVVCGAALVAGSVLLIVAIHFGRFG